MPQGDNNIPEANWNLNPKYCCALSNSDQRCKEPPVGSLLEELPFIVVVVIVGWRSDKL